MVTGSRKIQCVCMLKLLMFIAEGPDKPTTMTLMPPPAPSAAPKTSTSLPLFGDTIHLLTHDDLNISIGLKSRTCKSNYRTLMSSTSHPASNNCSIFHHISNV